MTADEQEVIRWARAIGYELVERNWRGKRAWAWEGRGGRPMYEERRLAISYMADYLPRRRIFS